MGGESKNKILLFFFYYLFFLGELLLATNFGLSNKKRECFLIVKPKSE